jgi:hypothetical protein
MNTSAKILCGRAIALHGAVTMDTNIVSNDCAAYAGGSGRSDFRSTGFSANSAVITKVPEPGTMALLAVGMAGLLVARHRRGLVARLLRLVASAG